MNTSIFATGKPVYIDFPLEDVRFRFDKGKAYRKFYGEMKETEVGQSNDLFRQAVLAGQQISEKDYASA
jgi:hypothetical protein